MNVAERDELLIRLDEKSNNTYKLVEKQERHLSTLNERVAKNLLNIDRNHNRLTDVEGSLAGGISLRLSKKQTATGGVSMATIIIMVIAGVGKVLGWW